MQFTFLDMAGKVLFLRDDAERADWTTEEMTLDADFPFLPNKKISIGQRVLFRNPADNSQQIYEIKQARTLQPDSCQQVTAENICISELSDEHIDNKEITNASVSSALSSILAGTLWHVGTVKVNPTSSVDISRGSVWQGVLQIKDNYNVYIEPRVSINNGTITRYLDVFDTAGNWNGVRLSIDKNMLDPSVTYDDSEVATALYGYGGTDPKDTSDDKKEITFANVVWAKTSDHPAKPAGQKYIEDPTATQNYGRNGRARFGFYQNSDILDPNVLLQKTWETLKVVSVPSISIEGTVADLYRMGYADQPLKLHDIALVDINPTGYKSRIQIIRMSVDLLDPSGTTLTIGSYIPNIIYIERKTNQSVTGSRGGGGGNKSSETERHEFETAIESINAGTALRFRAFQNDLEDMDNELKLQEASITVEHNRITQEVVDRRNSDGELSSKITQTATQILQRVHDGEEHTTSLINQQARQISLVVTGIGDNAKVNVASIIAGVNNQGSNVKIRADRIDLTGYVTATQLNAVQAEFDNLTAGTTTATFLKATSMSANSFTANSSLRLGSYTATWRLLQYVNHSGQNAEMYVLGRSA